MKVEIVGMAGGLMEMMGLEEMMWIVFVGNMGNINSLKYKNAIDVVDVLVPVMLFEPVKCIKQASLDMHRRRICYEIYLNQDILIIGHLARVGKCRKEEQIYCTAMTNQVFLRAYIITKKHRGLHMDRNHPTRP